MKKLLIGLLLIAVIGLTACAPSDLERIQEQERLLHEQKGDILEPMCLVKDPLDNVVVVDLSCDIDADCSFSAMGELCPEGGMPLPTCAPQAICHEGSCKVQCGYFGE